MDYKRPYSTDSSSHTKSRGFKSSSSHDCADLDTFRISYTPPNTFVAGFHFTIALLPAGPLLLTSPPLWYKPELVKVEKELEDEELKELLTKPLREKKAKKKKAAAEDETPEA